MGGHHHHHHHDDDHDDVPEAQLVAGATRVTAFAGADADAGEAPPLTLTLPFERRRKRRFRAVADDGTALGLILPPGSTLADGDRLVADDGRLIVVRAATEALSTARAAGVTLARAAYHLGNRHVPVQVGDGWLRWEPDHVLDAMVAGLGLPVTREDAPFEPERGAYADGGHAHAR